VNSRADVNLQVLARHVANPLELARRGVNRLELAKTFRCWAPASWRQVATQNVDGVDWEVDSMQRLKDLAAARLAMTLVLGEQAAAADAVR